MTFSLLRSTRRRLIVLGEREVLTEFEEILFKDLLDIDFHTRTLSDHFGGAKSDSIEFVLEFKF